MAVDFVTRSPEAAAIPIQTDAQRDSDRGLVLLIQTGAVLDSAFWLALLVATWVVIRCLSLSL